MEKHACSGSRIFNLVRMAIVPPNTYRFNIILIKIPASVGFFFFFCRHRHKIHIECKRCRIYLKNLKRTNWEDSHFSVSKLTSKLHLSRQYRTDINLDVWIHGMELRA